jgi:hypothetical protein
MTANLPLAAAYPKAVFGLMEDLTPVFARKAVRSSKILGASSHLSSISTLVLFLFHNALPRACQSCKYTRINTYLSLPQILTWRKFSEYRFNTGLAQNMFHLGILIFFNNILC